LPEAQKIIASLADIRCNILNRGSAIGGADFSLFQAGIYSEYKLVQKGVEWFGTTEK